MGVRWFPSNTHVCSCISKYLKEFDVCARLRVLLSLCLTLCVCDGVYLCEFQDNILYVLLCKIFMIFSRCFSSSRTTDYNIKCFAGNTIVV